MRKMLVDIEPGVVSHLYDLAIAHQQHGAMLVSAGELESATSAYRQAAEILQRVVQANPGDHQTRSNLGSMLSNLGTIEAKLGNTERGSGIAPPSPGSAADGR